jgi:hypothetical protein
MLYVEKAVIETVTLLKLIVPTMLAGMLIASLLYSLPQFKKVSDKITVLTFFANLRSGVAVAAFLYTRQQHYQYLQTCTRRN